MPSLASLRLQSDFLEKSESERGMQAQPVSRSTTLALRQLRPAHRRGGAFRSQLTLNTNSERRCLSFEYKNGRRNSKLNNSILRTFQLVVPLFVHKIVIFLVGKIHFFEIRVHPPVVLKFVIADVTSQEKQGPRG